jgi:hypothetical protein
MSLSTPSETVEKLQTSLQTKAKAKPAFRFYALWDKVCRQEVLLEAYGRCRANAGAAGVDGETFARIDAQGVERWLGTLRKELVFLGVTCPSPFCAYGYRRATEASGLSAFRASGTACADRCDGSSRQRARNRKDMRKCAAASARVSHGLSVTIADGGNPHF